EQGSCVFETIKPGRVPGNNGTLQAPHINVSVFARGILKRLATRIYFADSPANMEDPILALVPAERRSTLLTQPDATEKNLWLFDIHLCGEKETVFFDV
ncbi:MAG TPA: protocatechuate 3,4-dioxygenase subunit alpha, partial [Candidatus Angelobacter sp.]|nr:protocatechuate 3,4-dioxygenase subunit alpha [Candidatus Angelobacter sp.]